jgi:hypothetical protein
MNTLQHKRKAIRGYQDCFLLLFISTILMHSCTTVKEYQKNKLNDAEMQLSNRKIEKTELSFQTFREGSAGANSGKTGGGCGCN